MRLTVGRFLLPFALLVALAGCKGATPIKDVMADPAAWADKTVRVAGVVKESVGVFSAGAYQIDDGTGVLTVVTTENGVPTKGAKVGVEGKVKPGYVIGKESLTVLIEDKRYTP